MRNDPSPVNVGVAGAGAIAQVSHLPAYGKIPGVRVAAICDADRGKAERVASRYNVGRVTTSFEELAAMKDLQAVDICLPNHLHVPAALAALAAGKHVLCEKPFSGSSEEASRMVEAAARGGAILMTGFNNRFREDANVLKRFVAEGELGEVFYLKAGWLKHSTPRAVPEWHRVKRYAGGGVLVDLGVQILDLSLWFLDMPRVLSVAAAAHPRPVEDRIESTAAALLRLENGGTVTLEASWELITDRDVAYLDLFGEKGTAVLSPLRLEKEMHGSLVNVTPRIGPAGNSYQASYENEIRHFVECVRTGRKPLSPGEDAVATLKVLEALYTSATSGREVHLA